jgi:phosphate:Na+ symporter
MRMTNNIERIGDSVENIAQAIEDMIEGNLTFTDLAMGDLNQLVDKVAEFMDLIITAMRQRPSNFMNQADSLENAIDAMREKYRDDHIQRLRSCECGIDQGLVYVSLLTNLEKIGDYCFNIAEAVAGKSRRLSGFPIGPPFPVLWTLFVHRTVCLSGAVAQSQGRICLEGMPQTK